MPITSFECVCSLIFDVCNLLTCVPYPVTNREFCLYAEGVVVVRSKAINHLHGRGLDRRTVYQSIPIYLEARGSPWLATFHDVSNGLEASE